MSLAHLLIQNAAVSAVAFALLWMLALRLKDVSFIDAWWALGMAGLATLSLLTSGPTSPHKLALTLICLAWGLRLGVHLLLRWRRDGEDRRYAEMMAHARGQRGWSFAKASLLF